MQTIRDYKGRRAYRVLLDDGTVQYMTVERFRQFAKNINDKISRGLGGLSDEEIKTIEAVRAALLDNSLW